MIVVLFGKLSYTLLSFLRIVRLGNCINSWELYIFLVSPTKTFSSASLTSTAPFSTALCSSSTSNYSKISKKRKIIYFFDSHESVPYTQHQCLHNRNRSQPAVFRGQNAASGPPPSDHQSRAVGLG